MRPGLKSRKAFSSMVAFIATLTFAASILTAGEWTVETVDQSGPGRFVSMKVDRDGNVHVAYIPDLDPRPLKYAYWDHNLRRWFTMAVAYNASFCSLVLDSQQRPRMSFADNGTGKGAKLRYVYWNGTGWVNQAVSPAGDAVVAYYTSIALNAKDEPSFTYYDYIGQGGMDTLRLRSVMLTGSYWAVNVVDRGRGSGKFNSIAIDSKGTPHVAYANVKYETSGLRYGLWDGDHWKTEILEGGTNAFPVMSVAMILDGQDNPHIVYNDVQHRLVKYVTRRSGGPWIYQAVGTLVKEGYPDRYSIALDSQGNPYISYFDAGTGQVKLSFRKGGNWYSEIVAAGEAGFTSSIQIHDGLVWVAYADDITGSLKVAHRPLEEAHIPPTPEQKTAAKK